MKLRPMKKTIQMSVVRKQINNKSNIKIIKFPISGPGNVTSIGETKIICKDGRICKVNFFRPSGKGCLRFMPTKKHKQLCDWPCSNSGCYVEFTFTKNCAMHICSERQARAPKRIELKIINYMWILIIAATVLITILVITISWYKWKSRKYKMKMQNKHSELLELKNLSKNWVWDKRGERMEKTSSFEHIFRPPPSLSSFKRPQQQPPHQPQQGHNLRGAVYEEIRQQQPLAEIEVHNAE